MNSELIKVDVLVGIPASGKSTYTEHVWERGAVYVSSDRERLLINGSEESQANNDLVWASFYKKLALYIEEGYPHIVLDSTMARPKSRKEACRRIKELAEQLDKCVHIKGIFFDCDLQVSLYRNKMRSRQVPENVILSMHQSVTLHPPTLSEGFDSLEVLRTSPLSG